MCTFKMVRVGLVAALIGSTLPVAFAQKGMDQININGQFIIAARAGRVERVNALLDAGAKVNSRDRNGDSSLNIAASKGDDALVDALIKADADVNLANLAGVTPVMGAAFSANAAIIRKLVSRGANTESLDRVKKNAATYAASSGCTECLQELIRVGTRVNAPLDNQLTLLMWAAAYGHEPAVRLLLAQGADRAAKDNRGKTAADMAAEGHHPNIASLLNPP